MDGETLQDRIDEARFEELDRSAVEPDLPEVVLIQVRTGMWPGTAPLKPEDIGKSEDEVPKKLFKLGQKRLYSEAERKPFTSVAAKAGTVLRKVGIPFLLANTYVIPRLKLPETYKELKGLESEYEAAADSFVDRFETIKNDWINENWEHRKKLQAFYPNRSELREYFKYRVIVFEIRGISAKESDEQVLIESVTKAREDFEGLCADMVGEAVEVLRAKVATTIANLTDRIRSGKIIRNDTLESVKNIHEQFKELNIFGDTNVENSLRKLQEMLDGIQDAAFLKDNTRMQNEILELADQVAKQAEDLTDIKTLSGRYKRLIDMG